MQYYLHCFTRLVQIISHRQEIIIKTKISTYQRLQPVIGFCPRTSPRWRDQNEKCHQPCCQLKDRPGWLDATSPPLHPRRSSSQREPLAQTETEAKSFFFRVTRAGRGRVSDTVQWIDDDNNAAVRLRDPRENWIFFFFCLTPSMIGQLTCT